MHRKFWILPLALGAVVTLAGCGGAKTPAAVAPAASATPPAADAPMAAAEAPTAAGEPMPASTATSYLGAKATAAGLGTDGKPVISVTGTDTTCKADKATVAAGDVWIKITNKGMKTTEIYLEDSKKTELVEVEKITTGNFGAFKTTVKKGSYFLACEPGSKPGKPAPQIRATLTVTPGM